MDGWIEALALLILIALSGAGEFFKKVRKSTQEPSKKPAETAKPASAPQPEWYKGTPSKAPQTPKEKQKEDPFTTIFKEMFDVEEPEIVIVDEEPPPPPPSQRPRTERPNKRTFEEWDFPVEHEKPVFRPDIRTQREPERKPPRSKPVAKPKTDLPAPKVMRPAPRASEWLAGASAHSPQSAFQTLYDRFGDNPLKLAVVYNEILNRPRALREKSLRRYT